MAVKYLKRQNLTVNKIIMKELNTMREMEHENILKFYGLCIENSKVFMKHSLAELKMYILSMKLIFSNVTTGVPCAAPWFVTNTHFLP